MGKVFVIFISEILNMGKGSLFLVCSQILNMGKVLFFSGLHIHPEYGKGFLCFAVCLQILNMRKVSLFSGLLTDPKYMGKVFFVFRSAHGS